MGVYALSVNLDTRDPYCFFVQPAEGDSIYVHYSISGKNEEKMNMWVLDPRGSTLKEISDQ